MERNKENTAYASGMRGLIYLPTNSICIHMVVTIGADSNSLYMQIQ